MKIANFTINQESPCFVIAEIANNHNQDKQQAIKLIKIAAESGAQAVKFQTFAGLDIAAQNQLSSDYDWPPAHKYKYWHEFLDTIMLPFAWYPELIELTHSLGMAFIATPCSVERARFLADVGADAIMIHSKEKSPEEILEFCEGYSQFENKVPLVAVPSTYSVIYEEEL